MFKWEPNTSYRSSYGPLSVQCLY